MYVVVYYNVMFNQYVSMLQYVSLILLRMYLLRTVCQLRLLINFTLSLWDVFSQDYCSIDNAFGVLFPSLLPALRESPPGGEPQAARSDDGD